MTVVSRDVFVRGGRVDRDVVRDTRIVNEVSRAPVLRGPIPVLPTRESIRVSTVAVQGRAAIRPPEQIGRREVVTRSIPPPAPPSFDRKLEVIRERGGEPVTADVARRLSTEERRGETRVQPVRPAGRDGVVLAPRSEGATTRKPQPLPPSAERPRETADRPVRRDEAPPTRVPEPRREIEPARPANEPRHVDVPAPTPQRGWAPAPRSEPKGEVAPTAARSGTEARAPRRGEASRAELSTSRLPCRHRGPRTWAAPEPRRQRVETAPVPAAPVETDVRKAEPRRSSPEKGAEKGRAEEGGTGGGRGEADPDTEEGERTSEARRGPRQGKRLKAHSVSLRSRRSPLPAARPRAAGSESLARVARSSDRSSSRFCTGEMPAVNSFECRA